MLSPNVSPLFPHRDRLEIRGHQDFATALSTDDNRSATNFRDKITISVSALVTELYAV
jgi:hypothetical protein